jgi:hypothetical protein
MGEQLDGTRHEQLDGTREGLDSRRDRPERDGIGGKLKRLVRSLLEPLQQDVSSAADPSDAHPSVCRLCRSSFVKLVHSHEGCTPQRSILLRCPECFETHLVVLSDETARYLEHDLERRPHPQRPHPPNGAA